MNFRSLVEFDTRRFSIRPILRVVKATRSDPSFAAVVEREGVLCYVFVSYRFNLFAGIFEICFLRF